MKQYIISNGRGLYFVEGSGFTGSRSQATRVSESNIRSTQDCLRRTTGNGGTIEAVGSSFGVCYVREQNIGRAFNGRPVVNADKNNPSAKRFASEGEAHNHGTRNTKSQGHRGYFVIETTDAVTHYVSTKEDKDGLTCPIANK